MVLDLETGDPDDFLTLLLLLDHPRVDLRAVTITPGTADQVGLVRRALHWFGRGTLPVGASQITIDKRAVSAWHYKSFGPTPPSRDAEPANELLVRILDPDTTLVTGAAPRNLGAALAYAPNLAINWWVAQGGFAGEGVVPPERQLPKFRGFMTFPSFNLNGAPRAVFAALSAPGIRRRRFVSKNVCHGVIYDRAMHARFATASVRRQSIALVYQSMERYLRDHPAGKAFHDPLAAACAIDEGVGEWAEVEIYRNTDGWGARLAPGSSTSIIIGYDHERLLSTLLV